MEMDQINEHQVFKDHGKAKYNRKSNQISNASQGYHKIKVFACNHDGYHKAQLVAAGNLTPIPKGILKMIESRVITTTFLDANLLHGIITRNSVTTVLPFINTTPIDWCLKDKLLWRQPQMVQSL